MNRRVPEAFTTGLDRHNAGKAWLAGYDAAIEAHFEQLRSYVQHKRPCASELFDYMGYIGPSDKPCDCGLDDVLKAIGGK